MQRGKVVCLDKERKLFHCFDAPPITAHGFHSTHFTHIQKKSFDGGAQFMSLVKQNRMSFVTP